MKLKHAKTLGGILGTLIGLLINGSFAVAGWVLFNILGGVGQWYGWVILGLAVLFTLRALIGLALGAAVTITAWAGK